MASDIHVLLRAKLKAAHRILVACHIRPDGDAIGSLLGLGLALEANGKQVQMVSVDGVPSSFRHLAGRDKITSQPEGEFDLAIVVDSSDLERVGNALDIYGIPDINIDHHVTNLRYANINLVDTQAVATAEMIASYLPDWELPMTESIAEALLTGLITDTLGFRTSNMTPRALRLAAELMEAGANISVLYNQALAERTFEATRFWGAGLARLEREDGLVWTKLTMEDRAAAGYSGRDDADLINILSTIEEAQVAMIFVEQPNGNIKVSWRSRPGYDVSNVALRFGGGGHPAASGAEVEGTMEEVRQRVIAETRPLLMKELIAQPK